MFGVYRTVAQVGMDEKERRLSATCANCGGPIPPNTQVAVMIGQGGQRLVCHAEYNCSPRAARSTASGARGGLSPPMKKSSNADGPACAAP